MSKLQEAKVYYTGNTWQNPGDIVLISGSQIGESVSQAFLIKVDDVREKESGSYFPHCLYDQNSVESEFFDIVNPEIQKENTVEVNILQQTKNSIKFLLPKEFSAGIYQVLLIGKDKCQNLLYLNIPEVNFVLGNEGGQATRDGFLRVCGSNICPENAPNNVLLQIKNHKYNHVLQAKRLDPPYCAEFDVPGDILSGEYEVSIYNGYGDDCCWSSPKKITIGNKPVDTWPKEVFNVKDFGAKGIGQRFNDMPAIIQAIRAAKNNGGGVVYFPRGTYSMNYQLEIPENVIMKGDGITKTKIMFIPYLWDLNQLPLYMFQLSSNNEITGIDFSGTRSGPVFVAHGSKLENIYIHHCRLYLTPYNGGPSDSHARGNLRERWELYGLVNEEMQGFEHDNAPCFLQAGNVQNLQIYNNDVDIKSELFWINNCENVYIGHNLFVGGLWATQNLKNAILEYNHEERHTTCIAGDNVYIAHNNFRNTDLNNREMMTTDGPNPYGNDDGTTYMEALPDDKRKYRLPVKFTKNKLLGCQVYVLEGVGEGQMRRIVENEGNIITLDSEFAVQPVDNVSKMSVMCARTNMIYTKNHYYNGGPFQFYGTQLNSILDDNEFEKMIGIVLRGGPIYGTINPLWYITLNNNRLHDANFLGHRFDIASYGVTYDPKIEIRGTGKMDNVQLGLVIKNNALEDGFYFTMASSNSHLQTRPIVDMIFHNNTISDAQYAFYGDFCEWCDGVVMADNTLTNINLPFTMDMDPLKSKKNELNSNRYLFTVSNK